MQGVTKQVSGWGGVYSAGEVSWWSCGCRLWLWVCLRETWTVVETFLNTRWWNILYSGSSQVVYYQSYKLWFLKLSAMVYVSEWYILHYGLEALLNVSIARPWVLYWLCRCLWGFCGFVDFRFWTSWFVCSAGLVTGCGLCTWKVPISGRAMVSLPTLAPQVAVSIPGSKV